MKVCGICNRVYPDDVSVCEHDGQRLIPVRRAAVTSAGPVLDWEGPMPGDLVGNYRLEQMVAEGGMGRVFRATHLSLGRPAAIKFLLPEHATRADLVQRFFNEARAVNAIRHPHIIDIFDFVQESSPDGKARVYMVMELLDGEDARTRLYRAGPFHPRALFSLTLQVAETLAAAHDAGLLHRDLKPDNIFLCNDHGEDDFVKLLDFGAAKAFGERPGHHLTRPGVAIGTPEYMSPEQILNRPLDGRVDAYGLGVVCYELATGSLPFTADKVANLLALHTNEEPEPLHVRRALEPPLPEPFEAVIMRCLAKEPAARCKDLWDLAHQLHACAPAIEALPLPVRARRDAPENAARAGSGEARRSSGSPPVGREAEALPAASSPPSTRPPAGPVEAEDEQPTSAWATVDEESPASPKRRRLWPFAVGLALLALAVLLALGLRS